MWHFHIIHIFIRLVNLWKSSKLGFHNQRDWSIHNQRDGSIPTSRGCLKTLVWFTQALTRKSFTEVNMSSLTWACSLYNYKDCTPYFHHYKCYEFLFTTITFSLTNRDCQINPGHIFQPSLFFLQRIGRLKLDTPSPFLKEIKTMIKSYPSIYCNWWVVSWTPSKAPIVSLSKKRYPHCSVLVGSKNGFQHDFTIKLK